MLIIGHRGKPRLAPENTLDSIRRCVEDPKVNGVEFDVWLTLDKWLAVIHDKELSRTTDGVGQVTQKSWDEIQRCRCKLNEQLTDEPIPELHTAYVNEYRFDWCCLHYSSISPSIVVAAQDAGAQVLAWTPDESQEWERLQRIGVDAICTNLVDECKLHFADMSTVLNQT
jgi:glycerophosphoryl diester phosphodiesterase